MISHENTAALQMPASTISSAIDVLIEKDYVEIGNRSKLPILSVNLRTFIKKLWKWKRKRPRGIRVVVITPTSIASKDRGELIGKFHNLSLS